MSEADDDHLAMLGRAMRPEASENNSRDDGIHATAHAPQIVNVETLGKHGLDATIERLKAEYRVLTRETYQEPDCIRLMAGR